MTADATSTQPGSGTYPRIRPPNPATMTPPHGTPALPPAPPSPEPVVADVGRWNGVPDCAVAAAITDEALEVADRARSLRVRVSYERRGLLAFLAARGVTPPTGA